jgi:uridine phosphorylase
VIDAEYPILEYDPAPAAVISPGDPCLPRLPERCVLCFFQDVISAVCVETGLTPVCQFGSELGPLPVYQIEVRGAPLAVMHPGIGAPFAAAMLEEAIAQGVSKVIACGGAGVLDGAVAAGHLLVPTAALRDEGTSYHYLPPSREVSASLEAVAAIEATLCSRGRSYRLCKSWTTDAFYRETAALVRRRRDEGCVSVEMEAAALFAVARFRCITLGQILYGGDDVSGEEWDSRDWQKRRSVRESLFWLAVEACLAL